MKGIGYDLDDNLDVNQPYFKIIGTVTSIIKVDNTKESFGKDRKTAYFKVKVQTSTGKSHFVLFCYVEPYLQVGKEYVLQGYINSTNGINIYLNLRKAFNLEHNNFVISDDLPWNEPLKEKENNDVNQIIANPELCKLPLSTFPNQTIFKVVQEIFRTDKE